MVFLCMVFGPIALGCIRLFMPPASPRLVYEASHKLPVPSESRMIRLFAIRTLAQTLSRETDLSQGMQEVSQGLTRRNMKWATIACPPACRDARDPSDAHTLVVRSAGAAAARYEYCGATGGHCNADQAPRV